MDLFKVKRFRISRKPKMEKDLDDKLVQNPEERRRSTDMNILNKSNNDNTDHAEEDDEDDDYISNEVQRRFKELRRNSFMSLIPEENGNEEEDDDGEDEEIQTSFTEERDVEVPNYQLLWCDFATFYRSYCERMLLFDKISVQLVKEADSYLTVPMSPRSAHKKLSLPFRCLYLKNIKPPRDETEQLQQLEISPLQDLETAYVAQSCLSWEALHCQYTQLKQKVSAQAKCPTRYNHCAQEFQQFQVLLQRFIENEPYQESSRIEQFARARILFPKLLHVPSVHGSDSISVDEGDVAILSLDLLQLIESSVLTYLSFLKADKKKSNGVRKLLRGNNQMAAPMQQVHAAIDKKKRKLKELAKNKRGLKYKSWPTSDYKVDLLLAVIEVKLVARVMRMAKLTKEQIIWCEDKMKKLNLSDGKLQRDPSPLLFPC